jgi:hypothetical protein
MVDRSERICNATRKDGQPCQARALTADGRCAAHGGLVDMRAAGRLGGKASVRSRLGFGPDVADDELREKARRRLNAMLDSKDEKLQLVAARSLFSYGTTPAPSADAAESAAPPPTLQDGRRVTGLADVLELADQLGVSVEPLRELRDENAQLRSELEQLRAAR